MLIEIGNFLFVRNVANTELHNYLFRINTFIR